MVHEDSVNKSLDDLIKQRKKQSPRPGKAQQSKKKPARSRTTTQRKRSTTAATKPAALKTLPSHKTTPAAKPAPAQNSDKEERLAKIQQLVRCVADLL